MSVGRKAFGCLVKRSLWLPSLKGWLVILVVVLLAGYGLVAGIHPFLALDAPVPAKVMVVEGWIPMPAIREAAERYRSGEYEMLCAVGGPESDEPSRRGHNRAEVLADQFLELGLPLDQVHAVYSGDPQRDRTYTSARVLRDWFSKRGELPVGLNVVTEGAHARRSRLLFDKALGDEVAVGVISIPDRKYEAARWWRYSEGVKEVVSEAAAYLYARFLFRPE